MFTGRVTASRRCGLRRTHEPVQHARPFFLGEHLRLHRSAQYLHGVLRARHHALFLGARRSATSAPYRCSWRRSASSSPCTAAAFATVPAYLRDVFGTDASRRHSRRAADGMVGAGVLGPVLVNYIRAYQIDHGVPKAQAYSITMYIMCGLLLIGFICNFAMRPVDSKYPLSGWSARGGAGREQVIMKARLGIHVARGRNSVIVGSVEHAAECFEIISMTRRATPGKGVRHEHQFESRAACRADRRHPDSRDAEIVELHRRAVLDRRLACWACSVRADRSISDDTAPRRDTAQRRAVRTAESRAGIPACGRGKVAVVARSDVAQRRRRPGRASGLINPAGLPEI